MTTATAPTKAVPLAPANDPMDAVEVPARRTKQTRHRRVLVEVETPDLAELTEALAGGFVAGLAVLACKVIQEEQESNAMSEQGKYYESGQ